MIDRQDPKDIVLVKLDKVLANVTRFKERIDATSTPSGRYSTGQRLGESLA